MAVGPVVHQVDGGQQVGLVQLPLPVKEKFSFLGVDITLYLGPVILQLVECYSRVDIFMKILHVVNLKFGHFNIYSTLLSNGRLCYALKTRLIGVGAIGRENI